MSGNAQSLGLATQMINEIMMGVPSSKIGANLPTPALASPAGGYGLTPYGGYAQPAPTGYGMQYGMPQQIPQQMPIHQQPVSDKY